MGAGNIIGYKDVPVYYIDYTNFEEFDFDNLDSTIKEIATTLGLKNYKINRKWLRDGCNDWKVLIEFDDMIILICDNNWSFGICCVPSEDYDDDEIYNVVFTEAANKFMRKISNMYPLYVRKSAWTSEEIDNPNTYQYY